MGFDVYGLKATTETGAYFRNNVWHWRPLAHYVKQVAPRITNKCKNWHTNDGDGLSATDASRLAKALQKQVDSGETAKYALGYAEFQAAVPDEPCTYCESTGYRSTDIGNLNRCNACNGKGSRRPFDTQYPFSVENVEAFILFLKDCGGFTIN